MNFHIPEPNINSCRFTEEMEISESIKERKPAFSLSGFLAQVKSNVKLLCKSVIRRHHYLPHQQVQFSDLACAARTRENKAVYNRFEQNIFQILLEKGSLTGYKKNKVWNEKELPLEGENARAYRLNSSHIACTPDVYCYSLPKAGVTGAEGYIYDVETKKYISETLRQWFRWDNRFTNSYLSSFRDFRPVYVPGVTLCIAKPGSDSYFHFLHESLTIFLLMQQRFPHITFDNIIVNGSRQRYKNEWLQLADAKNVNIIYTEYSSHFVCEQLLFLSDLCFQYSPNLLTTHLLKALQPNNIGKSGRSLPEIVIASRADAQYRTISWENELAESCGAEVIRFSDLTPQEVMETCYHCKVFIGAHGAAFSNTVFCKPGTKVIEIVFGHNEVLYSRLSDVCNLDHLVFDVSQKEEILHFLHSLRLNELC